MAKIVMGIGSSHSPALLMKPDAWLARANADDKRDMFALHDHTGRKLSYAELEAQAPATILDEIKPDILQARHEANEAGIRKIADALDACDPDIVLLIGDDHKEVYQDDNMPALAVYWGETLPYRPKGMMKWKYDPSIMPDFWYWQDERDYPVASGFARRLIGDLMARDFDPAHSKYYPEGQGMTHSFGYVYRRIMERKTYPVLPVSVNTYYPPNQMHPGRCYRLGEALRDAIESWPEDLRVAVMATGGLSHFVVDEKFDRDFIDVMATGGHAEHAALPLEKLQSGNSELRCWSVLAGAVKGMEMNLIDYVPCYRSEAGTGCAMAFATWE